ncbi:MAG: ribbon-helix-helix domain-containing protein [Mycoplasmataceae bacterium]|jgi:predicted HicB family RNase H-like nuclease|nr:ribbon-helix-helix domain-containing protein [Mycoplasmataceae bacterium]
MKKRLPINKTFSQNDSDIKITNIGEAHKSSEICEKQEYAYANKIGLIPPKQKFELDKKRINFYLSKQLVSKISKIAKNKGYSTSEYLEAMIKQQILLEEENG